MQHRSRAWRRAKTRAYKKKSNSVKSSSWPHEKNWKHLYTRKEKLRRAKQLSKIWPARNWKEILKDLNDIKLLFVCSMNQWRSPTGEAIYRKVDGVSARSGGTSKAAKKRVTIKDIGWADIILVMEEKHKSRLTAEYRQNIRYKTIHVLDIPDNYRFMDEELLEIIREKVDTLVFSEDGSGL